MKEQDKENKKITIIQKTNKVSEDKNKKKIIINPFKKSEDIFKTEIKSEADFLSKISRLLKTSQRCEECRHRKSNGNQGFICSNFEALWFHRDNGFSQFNECTYQTAKEKASTP